MPNAELVHSDIYQNIQYNANFSVKEYKGEIYTIMKNNDDSTFRLLRSNLFGLGDLTKNSLYYFGTFANFTRPIVNFNKLWFFAQNLGKLKL